MRYLGQLRLNPPARGGKSSVATMRKEERDHGRPRCQGSKCIVAGVDGALMVKSAPTMEAPQVLDKLGFGLDMF
ncbi:hypothetical protein L484_008976 [Morus notabilis]|uniref:Uncharacterized protein n=1 Tax=Morus notabilis TaxID=981085 RepID=W9RF53_9ROSA|nr:hypothetical protein L484_003296 [Morus notabilis]EXB53692.1 hypothetical protein L484_008976 [Morus notabilis]